ncbi:hypothetical protein Tco_0517735 [Tanacetum coccineum]
MGGLLVVGGCIDTYQGLIEAVRASLPQVEHKHFTRHLYANFQRKWVGLHYKRLFWSAAVSTIEQDSTSKMKEIRQSDLEFTFILWREIQAHGVKHSSRKIHVVPPLRMGYQRALRESIAIPTTTLI